MLADQPAWRVASDKWVVGLLLAYWCVELPEALLGSVGTISDQSMRVIGLTTDLLLCGLFSVLVFQGAYFWRLGRREWRWRLQLIGCLLAVNLMLLTAIGLANQLQKDVGELVDAKPTFSRERVGELLARPDVSSEQRVSLSKFAASNAYIHAGEFRLVFDERGQLAEYRPTASDMEMRRMVVSLKAGGIRPMYQEIIGGVALLACLLAAAAGYAQAVQFSNRAPNASL